MKNKQLILIALVVVIMIGFFSMFTVLQTQRAIVLRLGKINTNAQGQYQIYGPGLHFKLPIAESVKRFDTRLRTLDIDSSRIMTKEQKEVLVDAYVKWKIVDVVKYYKSIGANTSKARELLKQQLNDGIRASFGRQTITSLLSDKRARVMQEILRNVEQGAEPLGIKVVDVRIKRIDLPTEVANTIYDRMRSAREKMASLIRSRGEQHAEIIKAKADAKAAVTISQAQSQGASIRAEGDARAAKIYLESYKKDPEFYSFYRSLKAYYDVFGKHRNTLVMQPKSQFFQYFNNVGAIKADAKS